MDILEAIFKALFKNAAAGEMAFFLAGILSCLFFLTYYLKFFDNWDEHRDLLKELVILLKEIRDNQKAKRIRDRLQRGEDITENF